MGHAGIAGWLLNGMGALFWVLLAMFLAALVRLAFGNTDRRDMRK